MAKDRVDIDELNHDLDSFAPVPDENHQFDKDEEYVKRDDEEILEELTKMIARFQSNKVESLFDGVPMPKETKVVYDPKHYDKPAKPYVYQAKGRLWND